MGCDECTCHEVGATDNICNQVTGECECKVRYAGEHCDDCDVRTQKKLIPDGYLKILLFFPVGFWQFRT
jgi:hypothetical protein